MADHARSGALGGVLSVARRLHIGEGVRVLSSHAPKAVQARVDTLRTRLRSRSGDLAQVPELDSLVPEAELERCYRSSLSLLGQRLGPGAVGDYLEFGVYTGGSLACMYRATEQEGVQHMRLFGFDSFEGLPAAAAADDTAEFGEWEPGDFGAPIGVTREVLRNKDVDMGRVTLVKGWYEDTLTAAWLAENQVAKAGVIMIDCDLYSSAKTALDFCAPLIRDEAVVLFDEWKPATMAADNAGEKRAFDEFMAANPSFSASELESYAPDEAKVFHVVNDG